MVDRVVKVVKGGAYTCHAFGDVCVSVAATVVVVVTVIIVVVFVVVVVVVAVGTVSSHQGIVIRLVEQEFEMQFILCIS